MTGAIRTDLILSAEIMVIALNEVADQAFLPRLVILVVVALALTVAVYGVVAVIVKMDDVGLHLTQTASRIGQHVGRGLVAGMPTLLSALSAIGTAAMLWVGGHILLAGSDHLGWHTPYDVGPPCRGSGSPPGQGFWCGAGLVGRYWGVGVGWFGRRSRRRRDSCICCCSLGEVAKLLKSRRWRRMQTASSAHRSGVMRCSTTVFVAMITFGLVACSAPSKSPTAPTSTPRPHPVATTLPAAPPLAADPAVLGGDLAADEQALRDPSSSEAVLAAAAQRQQSAYRALGRHPEWDSIVRPKIPPSLLETYDRNVDARRQLTALSGGEAKDTLPAWRIDPPAPADALLGYYHEADAASGVGWNYLAAINLVETGLGRIIGVSTAGAEGPMQFLPVDLRHLWQRQRRPLTA